jgi:hypothetical protein
MDEFVRSQNVERYRRFLERVTDEPDRQQIINLLAEERQKQKDVSERLGDCHAEALHLDDLGLRFGQRRRRNHCRSRDLLARHYRSIEPINPLSHHVHSQQETRVP